MSEVSYLVKPEVYDTLYRDEQFTKYECLLRRVKDVRGSVADVGCGTALFYEYLLFKGLAPTRYVCLDPSEEMLEVAASKLSKRANTILVVSYAEEMPLRDLLFDLTVSISTWGAISDKASALEEMLRVTKPGGTVIVTGHPRTYSVKPSDLNPKFKYHAECIDEFYIASNDPS